MALIGLVSALVMPAVNPPPPEAAPPPAQPAEPREVPIESLSPDEQIERVLAKQRQEAERLAREQCRRAIVEAATLPASVRFPWFPGVHQLEWQSEDWLTIVRDFSAQNRLGAEISHRAVCLHDSEGSIVSVRIQ